MKDVPTMPLIEEPGASEGQRLNCVFMMDVPNKPEKVESAPSIGKSTHKKG